MLKRPEQVIRDRAINVVRLATLSGSLSAIGLTWLFSNLAIEYFSGKPAAAHVTPPSPVPALAEPVQSPPSVIVKVVHRQASLPASGAAPAPRPPAQGPAPAPPAPPPVCHSTPSKPC
jgi:hypothetical protein